MTLSREQKTEQTKGLLRWAALFLGELRDGLTMVSRHVTPNGHYGTETDPFLLDQHAERIFDCSKRLQ
jgi:hypothetical protein